MKQRIISAFLAITLSLCFGSSIALAKTKEIKSKSAQSIKSKKSSTKTSTINSKKKTTANTTSKKTKITHQIKQGQRMDYNDVSPTFTNKGSPNLASAAALMIDIENGKPIYQKNPDRVLPIASITKLMTAMVVLDSKPDMNETIIITEKDVDTIKNSHSRLPVGTKLTRQEAFLLALMSSENRAAHALARNYPGGTSAFVLAMNKKAKSIGMIHSKFEDPTGLDADNVSTALDLSKMVVAASKYKSIENATTTGDALMMIGRQMKSYRNTNPLVRSSTWDIDLSKTGYIQEAGRCLVMKATVNNKPVAIVLLDSKGQMTRIGDANRLKQWAERNNS